MKKIETKLKLGKALHLHGNQSFSVHFNKVFKSFKSAEIALEVQQWETSLEHVIIMPVKAEENLHYIHNAQLRPKNVLEQSAFWNLYGFISDWTEGKSNKINGKKNPTHFFQIVILRNSTSLRKCLSQLCLCLHGCKPKCLCFTYSSSFFLCLGNE